MKKNKIFLASVVVLLIALWVGLFAGTHTELGRKLGGQNFNRSAMPRATPVPNPDLVDVQSLSAAVRKRIEAYQRPSDKLDVPQVVYKADSAERVNALYSKYGQGRLSQTGWAEPKPSQTPDFPQEGIPMEQFEALQHNFVLNKRRFEVPNLPDILLDLPNKPLLIHDTGLSVSGHSVIDRLWWLDDKTLLMATGAKFIPGGAVGSKPYNKVLIVYRVGEGEQVIAEGQWGGTYCASPKGGLRIMHENAAIVDPPHVSRFFIVQEVDNSALELGPLTSENWRENFSKTTARWPANRNDPHRRDCRIYIEGPMQHKLGSWTYGSSGVAILEAIRINEGPYIGDRPYKLRWLNLKKEEFFPIDSQVKYYPRKDTWPIVDPTRDIFVVWPNSSDPIGQSSECHDFHEFFPFEKQPRSRCLTLGPGAHSAGFVPTQEGYWFANRDPQKQGGGVFFATETRWTQVLTGIASGLSLSPDGCRLAVRHAANTSARLGGRQTVKILDLCLKD
ncbi:MAG: hypothetical protein Alpg2KO_08350 [Alphaproteobacteria bacterium]